MNVRPIAYWPSLDRRTVEAIRQACAKDHAKEVAPNFALWLHGQAVMEIHRRESVECEDDIPHDVNALVIDTRLFSPLELSQAIKMVAMMTIESVTADPGRSFLCDLMYAISVVLVDSVGACGRERESVPHGIGQETRR